MSVKLLNELHFEFLSLKAGCTGCSESTLVKMPHCWKSYVAAHIVLAMSHFHWLKQQRNHSLTTHAPFIDHTCSYKHSWPTINSNKLYVPIYKGFSSCEHTWLYCVMPRACSEMYVELIVSMRGETEIGNQNAQAPDQ